VGQASLRGCNINEIRKVKMDLNRILSDLKAERDRLDRAIAALEGSAGGATRAGATGRRRGRPAGSGNGRRGRRGPRVMSADARRRISEAMRKRWAERKKRGS
jgi:hypothetical protein